MHVGRARTVEPTGLRSSTNTGQVWSDILFDSGGVRALSMFFSPGARTHWHTHEGGQLLYTLAGEGWVRTRGGEVAIMGPGDVVWAAAGEEHCHGATAMKMVSQLALHFAAVAWGSPVSDDEYAPSQPATQSDRP